MEHFAQQKQFISEQMANHENQQQGEEISVIDEELKDNLNVETKAEDQSMNNDEMLDSAQKDMDEEPETE